MNTAYHPVRVYANSTFENFALYPEGMKPKTKTDAQASVGKPRRVAVDERIEAILDAATEVFMENGYAKASTREIARCAGASKETFYQRFPTKASLFAAIIERQSDRLLHSMSHALEDEIDPYEALTVFSERLLMVMLNPESERLLQIVISDAREFPELAAAFWDKGPGLGRELLKAYFKRLAKRGLFRKEDVEFASEQFLGALVGSIALRRNLAMPPFLPNARAVEEWVRKTVDWFLRAHLNR